MEKYFIEGSESFLEAVHPILAHLIVVLGLFLLTLAACVAMRRNEEFPTFAWCSMRTFLMTGSFSMAFLPTWFLYYALIEGKYTSDFLIEFAIATVSFILLFLGLIYHNQRCMRIYCVGAIFTILTILISAFKRMMRDESIGFAKSLHPIGLTISTLIGLLVLTLATWKIIDKKHLSFTFVK